MKVVLVENHSGEGVFPTFSKLSKVEIIEECSFYLNWLKCRIDGLETYIPKNYINSSNELMYDYNPTELVCEEQDEVEVIKIVCGWIYGCKYETFGSLD